MNVAIFVTTLRPAGPSQRRMQDALLSLLIKEGSPEYNFFIISYDSVTLDGYDAFMHLPLESRGGAAKAWRRIKSLIKSIAYHRPSRAQHLSPISWIHTFKNSLKEPIYFPFLRQYNIRLLYNLNQHWLDSPIPYIRTVWDVNHRLHSFYPEFSYSRFGYNALDRGIGESLARASYVVTGTQAGANQLVTMYGLSATKSRVIPLPTPALISCSNNSQHSAFLKSKQPYLFYPARLWPHKNHSVIINALAVLKHRHNHLVDCIFVGHDSGNLAHLINLATELNVRDQIFYLGDVEDHELPFLYQNAFALVFASPAGPDNLPPLEAMALGCPAIVAQTEGADEQFGEAALFFEPYNEFDLASKILSLFAVDGLRHSLIQKGVSLTSLRTPVSYIQSILSIFEEFQLVSRNWARCDDSFT